MQVNSPEALTRDLAPLDGRRVRGELPGGVADPRKGALVLGMAR